MCCKNDGNCSCNKNDKRQTICIQDLSKSINGGYLVVDATFNQIVDTPGRVTADSVRAMSTLSTNYCVKLDPCCTAQISFVNSSNLLAFLRSNPTNEDENVRKYLRGQFNCTPGCC